MVKRVPNLSLAQVYPAAHGGFNLNTCADPDCGNYQEHASFVNALIKGPGAAKRKAALLSNTGITGWGTYTLHGSDEDFRRVSTVFEYKNDPHLWNDRRSIECQHDRGVGPCGNTLELLSNAHLVEELDRLRDHNGVFDGPRCGACGTRYLEKTDEFVLNGAHGKRTVKIDAEADRPVRLRVIHKPCRGKPGARFTVTLDHFRQKATAQNLQILQALVNGAGA